MAKKIIIDPNKEHFIAIYLCPVRKKPKCELISLGTLTACLVHPREVFRLAIKYNASDIIVLHNHPSSDVSPSEADITLTERLKKPGNCFLDHVIFEKGDRFYSFHNTP
jgi:DNA repair protein RadC